jgi:hypothetical protein
LRGDRATVVWNHVMGADRELAPLRTGIVIAWGLDRAIGVSTAEAGGDKWRAVSGSWDGRCERRTVAEGRERTQLPAILGFVGGDGTTLSVDGGRVK